MGRVCDPKATENDFRPQMNGLENEIRQSKDEQVGSCTAQLSELVAKLEATKKCYAISALRSSQIIIPPISRRQ